MCLCLCICIVVCSIIYHRTAQRPRTTKLLLLLLVESCDQNNYIYYYYYYIIQREKKRAWWQSRRQHTVQVVLWERHAPSAGEIGRPRRWRHHIPSTIDIGTTVVADGIVARWSFRCCYKYNTLLCMTECVLYGNKCLQHAIAVYAYMLCVAATCVVSIRTSVYFIMLCRNRTSRCECRGIGCLVCMRRVGLCETNAIRVIQRFRYHHSAHSL